MTVDGKWGVWASWSTCSVTCGGGTHSRSRACINPQYGGKTCNGESMEAQACNAHTCPGKV